MISSSLTEMTREDMEKMIAFRWTVVGGDKPPFTDEAYTLLYQLTKGNPRDVIKICEQSLLQAFLKQTQTITPDLIKKASAEL